MTNMQDKCLEILQKKFGNGKLWRGLQARTNTKGWHYQICVNNNMSTSIFVASRLSVKHCEELCK